MTQTLFGPEVRLMLEDNDLDGMKTFCETLHPATAAEALADGFTPEEAWRVLEQTNIRDQAAIFEYFPISWQVEMTEGTGRRQMARLIEQMSHDDRVDLLRRLPPRVAESLMRLVDEADRRDIADLFRYKENTVGAIMTTDYAWLPVHLTAGEAIERLRQQAPDRETLYYIYILDERTRKLVGVLSLRDLVLAPRHARIQDLMETEGLVTLRVNQDQEAAAHDVARFDFLALPVVDDERRLVGIVTHDDIIDVIQQEATEDLQKQGAVGPIPDNYLEVGFFTVWRKRALWLSLLFFGGMLTFTAMAAFEESLNSVRVLAYFVPLLIATGGNTGTQAATLITRALALGQVTVTDWLRVLRFELMMGLALGVFLGSLGLARSLLVSDDLLYVGDEPISAWRLGLVIGQAVTAICLFGTMIGSMLPIVFKKLGIDPAIASSPFVTTFVDVAGIIVYFSIARMYLL